MSYKIQSSIHQSLALIVLLLISFSSMALAETNSPNLLFEQANRDYSQGNFAKATSQYEKILQNHGLSAPTLYNLGNSYAQNSQPGKAVLSYLRALRLSPSDSDIKGNLQLIRKEQGLFQPERTLAQKFTHLLEMDQWCLMAGIAFGLLTLFHLFSYFKAVNKKSTLLVSTLLFFIVLCTVISLFTRYRDYHDGVITTSDVHLRISPFEAASSTGNLREGQVVKPVRTHDEYSLVEDRGGQSGWLHHDDFELIVKKF